MMTVNEFKKLNDTFTKKIVFRIGIDAGFFSEFNNMILTIHYCLANEIKFVLNSKDANFSFKKGWQDFFMPFCQEDNFALHKFFNSRLAKPNIAKKRDKVRNFFYQKYLNITGVDFLTYQILPVARKQNSNTKQKILLPGLYGDLFTNCRIITEMIWHFQPSILKEIEKIVSSITLPEQYVSFHVRRGDKSIESDFIPLENYISKAEKSTKIRSAFISTDDYSIYIELCSQFKNWTFYTLCDPSKQGYFQNEFDHKKPNWKKNELIDFFSSIDLLSKANFFFGTYTSNVGMFLALRMPKGKFIGVDYDNWSVW